MSQNKIKHFLYEVGEILINLVIYKLVDFEKLFMSWLHFKNIFLYEISRKYRVFKRNCRVLWGLIVGEQIIAASRVV